MAEQNKKKLESACFLPSFVFFESEGRFCDGCNIFKKNNTERDVQSGSTDQPVYIRTTLEA